MTSGDPPDDDGAKRSGWDALLAQQKESMASFAAQHEESMARLAAQHAAQNAGLEARLGVLERSFAAARVKPSEPPTTSALQNEP